MNKSVNFVLGTILGAAAGALVGYIFAPARNTSFDRSYRSRMDKALAEGEKAAAEREAELRKEFEQARRRRTPGQNVP
jgi:gas vesicle protein